MEGDERLGQARKKKLEEQQKQAAEAKQAEEHLKSTLRVVLDESAYGRMMNVKLAKPQLFLLAAQNVLALYKRAGRKITESELVFVLQRLRETKESGITFHRK